MNSTNPLHYVKTQLRAVGPKAWPRIATLTGKPVSLMRKIAYGDRRNPMLDSLLPLMRYFQRKAARTRKLAAKVTK